MSKGLYHVKSIFSSVCTKAAGKKTKISLFQIVAIFSLMGSAFGDSITLNEPDPGDTITRGSSYTIRWSSVGSFSNVRIQFKSGSSYTDIVSSTPNDGSYTWSVPSNGIIGSNLGLRISDVNRWPTVYDLNEPITIASSTPSGTVSITEPDPGDVLTRGTSFVIKWNSTGSFSNVRIQLKQGSGYTDIASSTSNDGSYTWSIPSDGVIGGDFEIRVSDVNKWSTVYDLSGLITIVSGTSSKPDLIVRDIEVDGSSSTRTYMVGETVRVECEVFNQGSGSAGSSSLGYYFASSRNDTSDRWESDGVSSLDAGEGDGEYENYTFTQSDVGTRYFVFKADRNDDVTDEVSEGNNVTSFGPFTVVEAQNEKPSVSITSGPSGTIDYDDVSFTYQGSDSDGTIQGYEVELDGNGAPTTSTGVSFNNLSEGSHTFKVRSQDDDGDFSDWVERSFTILLPNNAPNIGSLTHYPNSLVQGQELSLTANSVMDPDTGDSVTKVEFYRDSNANNQLDVSSDQFLGEDLSSTDGWSWTGETSGFTIGQNSFFARASDGELWSSPVSSSLVSISGERLVIPYYTQGTANWCWAASTSMLLKYYGYERKIWEVAADFDASKEEGMPVTDIFGPDIEQYLEEWYDSGHSDAWVVDHWVNADQTLITKLADILATGRPVLVGHLASNIEWGWPLESDAHAVIVSGFDGRNLDDNVFVNDPSGALFAANPSQPVTWSDFLLEMNDTILTLFGDMHILYANEGIFLPNNSGATISVEDGLLQFINNYNGIDRMLYLDYNGSDPYKGYFYKTDQPDWYMTDVNYGYSATGFDRMDYYPFLANSTGQSVEFRLFDILYKRVGNDLELIDSDTSDSFTIAPYSHLRQYGALNNRELNDLDNGTYLLVITLQSSDGSLSFDSCNIEFSINGAILPNPPEDILLSESLVNENKVIGTPIGIFSTIDPDSETFTYTKVSGAGDSDNDLFSINGNQLKSAISFDYETQSSYSIRIRTTDPDGLWYEESFTISISDVNEAPTSVLLSSNLIEENQASGSVIGILTTTDNEPPAGPFTYSLVPNSEDNEMFEVDGDNLKAAASFNYESKNRYSILVRTTDQGGLSHDELLDVFVSNINERPSDVDLSNHSVSENVSSGTLIGILSTDDPDGDTSFSYELASGSGSTDNGSFSIDDDKLKTATPFDYETQKSLTIRVLSTDGGGLSVPEVFTINVVDVDDQPTCKSLKLSGDQPAFQWSSFFSQTYTLLGSTNLTEGFFILKSGIEATPPENEESINVNDYKELFLKIRVDD